MSRRTAASLISVLLVAAVGLAPGFCPPAATAARAEVSHGLAMFDDLKYPADFRHFDYVNPDAPKGGTVRLSAIGTFDSFNNFIIKGNPASGLGRIYALTTGRIYDTLMTPALDEPFSEYGLLAESIETPPDRSWVAFTLRAGARWHDGRPVTADDVIWTFNTLLTAGEPAYRLYYGNVSRVSRTGERTVRFDFKEGVNRELPLILGQLPVLPKHWWADRDFNATLLERPLGSGPYRLGRFEAGRFEEYERVDDYWGADLPVNVGRHNIGTIRIDYYRDTTVAIEAFKGGEYDYRPENSSKAWATAYAGDALDQGLIVRGEFGHGMPAGMQGYAFNIRRPLFRDPAVRQALAYTFDFEWSNRTLFYGLYSRTRSFFDNSDLAATGLPSAAERAVLEPLRGRIPDAVFTEAYQPPRSDGAGGIRGNLKQAVTILRQAGWTVQDGVLTDATGRRLRFELLLVSPLMERIALPFRKNLARIGVDMSVRTVDAAHYQDRLRAFDFDMVVGSWGQSLSPGNEQRDYWGAEAADRPGSRNLVGIRDPAIDTLVEALIAAPDRESLMVRTRALDRVLQWNHFVIPQWYAPVDRLVFWDRFGRPDKVPLQGVAGAFDTWWIDPDRAARVDAARGRQ